MDLRGRRGRGVAAALPRTRTPAYAAQLLLVLAYTLLISIWLPAQWAHPFGPVLKNVPLLAMILFLFAMDRRHGPAVRQVPARALVHARVRHRHRPAFHLFFVSRTRDVRAIAVVARHVVVADWIFTATTIVFQPASGLYLAHRMGYPLTAPWLYWSIVAFVIATLCSST